MAVPHLNESIRRVGNHTWIVGTDKILTASSEKTPAPGCIVSWQDGDDTTFQLHHLEEEYTSPIDESVKDVVKQAFSGDVRSMQVRGVWFVGSDTVLKAAEWVEGTEPESATIAAVKQQFNDIPVPTVIHSWTDKKWSRSFFFMHRCHDKTLGDAWLTLGFEAQDAIAQDIVKLCSRLAGHRSAKYESLTGLAVAEPLFTCYGHVMPLERVTAAEFNKRLSRYAELPDAIRMGDQEEFIFCHTDLNPGNIFVSEDGRITKIIDWQWAGFHPRWYIASMVQSPIFQVDVLPEEGDKHMWQRLLFYYLYESGFKAAPELWEWKKLVHENHMTQGRRRRAGFTTQSHCRTTISIASMDGSIPSSRPIRQER